MSHGLKDTIHPSENWVVKNVYWIRQFSSK